jgi:hypothetical protein
VWRAAELRGSGDRVAAEGHFPVALLELGDDDQVAAGDAAFGAAAEDLVAEVDVDPLEGAGLGDRERRAALALGVGLAVVLVGAGALGDLDRAVGVGEMAVVEERFEDALTVGAGRAVELLAKHLAGGSEGW